MIVIIRSIKVYRFNDILFKSRQIINTQTPKKISINPVGENLLKDIQN